MRKWLGATNGGGKRAKRDTQQAFGTCPVCDKQVPTGTLNVHVSQCLDSAQLKQESNARRKVHVNAVQPREQENATVLAQPATITKKTSSTPNAFGALMKAARHNAIVHLITCDSDQACTWTQTSKPNLASISNNPGALPPVQTTLRGMSVNLAVRSSERPTDAMELTSMLHESCTERVWTTSQLSIPVLKSCLQKSVRRGLADVAVSAAAELIVRDLMAFLRRFPVIVLEDSILHPELDLFTSLMILVHKGQTPTVGQLRRCLGIVRQVANCRIKDDFFFKQNTNGTANATNYPTGQHKPRTLGEWQAMSPARLFLEVDNQTSSNDSDDGSKKHRGLSPRSAALVRSLIIRQQYGGMSGDMSAFGAMAAVWAARFDANSDGWHALIEQLAYIPTGLEPLASNLVPSDVPSARDIAVTDVPITDRRVTDTERRWQKSSLDTTLSLSPLCKQDAKLLSLGVDFHCCSWMIREVIRAVDIGHDGVLPSVLRGSGGEDPEDVVKSAIWNYRSSVNVRRHMREYCAEASDNRNNNNNGNDEDEVEVEADEIPLMSLPTLAGCALRGSIVACDEDAGRDLWNLVGPLVENVAVGVVNKGLAVTGPTVVCAIFDVVMP